MTQMLVIYGDVIMWGAVLGLILAVPAWLVRARARGRARAAGEVAVAFFALPVLYFTLAPTTYSHSQLSLVPGAELAHAVTRINEGISAGVVQMAGTLLLLAPLGAVLPLLWSQARSLPRIVGGAVALSALVETMQYVGLSGRVSSVDDVILMTLGATAGALATHYWWRGNRPAMTDRPAPRPVLGA